MVKFYYNSPSSRSLVEPEILDATIAIYNSIRYVSQDTTPKNVSWSYHIVSCKEVIFLVKFCKICHKKVHSKFKIPLVSIISIKLFEQVQINLIDMQLISDIITIFI